jgi:PRTRC genetic system protein B
MSADGDSQQTLLATIHLFDEAIYYTRHGADGVRSCYEVAPADLAAAFANVPLATPILPAGILHWSRADGRERPVLYLEPATRPVIILEEDGTRTPLSIPFPGLVFVGHGVDYQLYAVKARPSEMSERLFVAPFPNVDGARGKVCWGNARRPVATTKTVRAAWELFVAADFNNHWIDHCSESEPDDVRLLWRKLATGGASEYPLDDLVKTTYKLGDLLK